MEYDPAWGAWIMDDGSIQFVKHPYDKPNKTDQNDYDWDHTETYDEGY